MEHGAYNKSFQYSNTPSLQKTSVGGKTLQAHSAGGSKPSPPCLDSLLLVGRDRVLNLFKFSLLLIPLFLLYSPVVLEMAREWQSDPNYSHGFLIPLISGYFLWNQRRTLRGLERSPIMAGYIVLFFGLGLYVIGTMGDEMFMSRVSLLFVLAGLVLLVGGKEWFTHARLPLFYLVFMIPLPYFIYNELAVPLKLFAAKTATATLQFFSYSILREGNIIYLPDVTLQVADACSGMRSLISIIALAVAMSWFFHKVRWKQLTLVMISIPIAVLVNIIRIVGTCILSHRYGAKVAMGFFHEFAGLVIFCIAFIVLFGSSFLLSVIGEKRNKR
jgi:exosortase